MGLCHRTATRARDLPMRGRIKRLFCRILHTFVPRNYKIAIARCGVIRQIKGEDPLKNPLIKFKMNCLNIIQAENSFYLDCF